MASFYDKSYRTTDQYENPYVSKLRGVFESLDDEELLNALKGKIHRGCQGYKIKALWHSYLARFVLNLPSVAELIRCLQSNPLLCRQRVRRIEGNVEEIRTQMGIMNSRINVQIQITVAMWVTTMIGVIATLAAVLLRS